MTDQPTLDAPGALNWRACPHVWIDPDRMSGAVCFDGSRLPVGHLLKNLRGGATVAEFVEWFAADPEEVRAVLQWLIDGLATARASAGGGRTVAHLLEHLQGGASVAGFVEQHGADLEEVRAVLQWLIAGLAAARDTSLDPRFAGPPQDAHPDACPVCGYWFAAPPRVQQVRPGWRLIDRTEAGGVSYQRAERCPDTLCPWREADE